MISLDELKAVFNSSKLGGSEEETKIWSDLMSTVDNDGDGAINREEFFEAMGGVIQKRSSIKL